MELKPDHIRWFRMRRSGLVDPYPSLERTAERLIGVQGQLLPAADLAFWNRTARCTARTLAKARLERRSLVRLWGQRNTLHIYHVKDWPFLHSAFSERGSRLERRLEQAGLLADFRRLVRRTAKRLAAGETLAHKDIRSKKLEEGQDRWVISYVVLMTLVREGLVCYGPDRGNESSFVHREHWVPKLAWNPPPTEEAQRELARRYLSTYGPSAARDLAFWFGTSIAQAQRWIEGLGEDVSEVEVDGSSACCLTADLDALQQKPPPPSRWPVRMLYRFDPLLLATKDKSWLIDEAHYKKVWRAAAHVEAVLLVKGRIAGTWRYDRKPKGLDVRLQPFAPLSRPVRQRAEKQVAEIARFLGLPLNNFEVR